MTLENFLRNEGRQAAIKIYRPIYLVRFTKRSFLMCDVTQKISHSWLRGCNIDFFNKKNYTYFELVHIANKTLAFWGTFYHLRRKCSRWLSLIWKGFLVICGSLLWWWIFRTGSSELLHHLYLWSSENISASISWRAEKFSQLNPFWFLLSVLST